MKVYAVLVSNLMQPKLLTLSESEAHKYVQEYRHLWPSAFVTIYDVKVPEPQEEYVFVVVNNSAKILGVFKDNPPENLFTDYGASIQCKVEKAGDLRERQYKRLNELTDTIDKNDIELLKLAFKKGEL
jgi:hypothetical protein